MVDSSHDPICRSAKARLRDELARSLQNGLTFTRL
jgi:hypothetical protein